MKNIIILLLLLIATLSCGKKGDPEYKQSNKKIYYSKTI